jgi:hypothetical protein
VEFNEFLTSQGRLVCDTLFTYDLERQISASPERPIRFELPWEA